MGGNSTSVSRRCSSGGGSYHYRGYSTFPRLWHFEFASYWELHCVFEVRSAQQVRHRKECPKLPQFELQLLRTSMRRFVVFLRFAAACRRAARSDAGSLFQSE